MKLFWNLRSLFACKPIQDGDCILKVPYSVIFWSDDELKMIMISSLYHKTLKHKAQIERDFSFIKHVPDRFPQYFKDVTLYEFKHAYNLVFQLNLELGSAQGVFQWFLLQISLTMMQIQKHMS